MNAGRWMMACSCATEAPASGQSATARSTTNAAPPTSPAGAPLVDPGKSLGPIRIGMTQGDVAGTKLPLQKTRAEEWKAEPYRMLFENGRVVFIEAELRDLAGAVVGGATIAPDERSIEPIAAHLPGCGKIQFAEGGNLITCADGTITVAAAGPPGLVIFHVQAPEYAKRTAPPKPPETHPSAGPPCSGGGPCGPSGKK